MKTNNFPLILASASPRRQELLKSAGVPLEVIPSNTEEKFSFRETPEKHVVRLAREKACEVGRNYPERWILAADTVVVVDNRVLGKPRDAKEAGEMLRLLSGREHRVTTGYCLLHLSRSKRKEGHVTSRVRIKLLSPKEIRWYISTREPFDKAGAYAIQGKGAFMIKEVSGSYTNVVGLPLCEVIEALKEVGAAKLFHRRERRGR